MAVTAADGGWSEAQARRGSARTAPATPRRGAQPSVDPSNPRPWGDAAVVFNPQFALNTGATGSTPPFNGKVSRGHVEQLFSLPGEPKYGLRFMFNPTGLAVGYEVDTSTYDGRLTNWDEQQGFVSSRSIGFTLLFDRTLEVSWDEHNKGVYEDVRAFERMVGIREEGQPLHSWTPLKFYFGNAVAPQLVGVVVSASVNYTHFAHTMVPTRCVMQLSVLQKYYSDSDDTTGDDGDDDSEPLDPGATALPDTGSGDGVHVPQ